MKYRIEIVCIEGWIGETRTDMLYRINVFDSEGRHVNTNLTMYDSLEQAIESIPNHLKWAGVTK